MECCLRASPKHSLICLATVLLLHGLQNRAFAQQQSGPLTAETQLPNSPGQSTIGSITGSVADRDGAIVIGARIALTREAQANAGEQITISGSDGSFTFASVPPGSFNLSVSAAGFVSTQASGTLYPGEIYEVPQIAMPFVSTAIDVQVTALPQEVAQAQIEAEEQQRVLGFIPNFYVSYVSNPAPLTTKQKFELAWKTNLDPITFAATGAIAGIEQSLNDFSGYGQRTQGYAKRYAAAYGDGLIANMLGNAILPSILKQDPRYFYKGTGSARSRTAYAIASSVLCKGDNGHWQPNYSGILGSAAAGGISNLYYPATDRNGATLTVENTLIGIGGTAVANLFQEFVVRKLTPRLPQAAEATP
jgi:Carboxypeptidase regulatory-like domain